MKKLLRCVRNLLERWVNQLNVRLNDRELPQTSYRETPQEMSDLVEELPSTEVVDTTVSTPIEEESQQPSSSNDEFVSLCKCLAEMVKQYDMMAKQMPDGEAKDLLEDMSEQIISSMVLGGCQAITKEGSFNPLRHKPQPYRIVEEGTSIQSTLRAGVEVNGIVLIPALVKFLN